jgi:hypothetical protein
MTEQQVNLPLLFKKNDKMKYKREGKCSYHFPVISDLQNQVKYRKQQRIWPFEASHK